MSMKRQPRKEPRLEAGETAILPEMLVHGRMRQRIVAISHTRASRRRMARDTYLRNLVHSGAITPGDLDGAIDACSKALTEFTWLTEVDDAVLGRADCVFLVRHGRFPVDNSDFRLNGNYCRICRCLQFDPHYYDPQLEQLPQVLEAQRTASPAGDADLRVHTSALETVLVPSSASQGQPAPPQAARTGSSADARMAIKRGNAWAFVGVLAVGLVTAPILVTIVMRSFSQGAVATGMSIGVAWLALLAGALALTLPRRQSRHHGLRGRFGRSGGE